MGRYLFKLGDIMESGKYFLLTDSEEKEHLEAINLFINRHYSDFFYHLPRKFRVVNPKEYPKNLKNLLNNKYFYHQILSAWKKELKKRDNKYSLNKKDNFKNNVILAIILIIFLVGLITIVEFLLSIFF